MFNIGEDIEFLNEDGTLYEFPGYITKAQLIIEAGEPISMILHIVPVDLDIDITTLVLDPTEALRTLKLVGLVEEPKHDDQHNASR